MDPQPRFTLSTHGMALAKQRLAKRRRTTAIIPIATVPPPASAGSLALSIPTASSTLVAVPADDVPSSTTAARSEDAWELNAGESEAEDDTAENAATAAATGAILHCMICLDRSDGVPWFEYHVIDLASGESVKTPAKEYCWLCGNACEVSHNI